MKQSMVNSSLVLSHVQKFEGSSTETYIAKVRVNGEKFNVTYDCKADNVMIHEWYKIQKNSLDIITKLIRECFKHDMAKEIISCCRSYN